MSIARDGNGRASPAVPNLVPTSKPDILLGSAIQSDGNASSNATYRYSVVVHHKSSKCRIFSVGGTQNPPVLSTLGVRFPLPAPALTRLELPLIALRGMDPRSFEEQACRKMTSRLKLPSPPFISTR